MKSIPEFHAPPLDRRVLVYLQVEELREQLGRVEALWNEALELLTPAADWIDMRMNGFIKSLPAEARQSAALERWLDGCDKVALLAASIGEDLERQARILVKQRESFAGYVLDRIGSYLVEFWIANLDHHVEEVLGKEGCVCTRRYSPGYAAPPLEMQVVFLEFAQRRIPFLRLSDAHVLLPEKSVFALKGVSGYRSEALHNE